jgi:hypothetical protein
MPPVGRFLSTEERLLALSPILTERGLALAYAAETGERAERIFDKAFPRAPKLRRKHEGIEAARFWERHRG